MLVLKKEGEAEGEAERGRDEGREGGKRERAREGEGGRERGGERARFRVEELLSGSLWSGRRAVSVEEKGRWRGRGREREGRRERGECASDTRRRAEPNSARHQACQCLRESEVESELGGERE